MSKFRLFIGNLSPGVKEGELRSKFESLLSSHAEAQVGQVEVRVKNEDNFFGFVNVHVAGGDGDRPPPYLLKSIDLMNNTKWKGSLIKVQLAKESFLDKLKREREGGEKDEEGQPAKDSEGTNNSLGRESFGRESFRRDGFQGGNDRRDNFRNTRMGFKDNFDFEIVSNNHLDKKGEGKGESSDEEEEETSGGIPKFKGLLLSYPNELPPIPIFPEAKDLQNQMQLGTETDQVSEGLKIDETMTRLQKIAGYAAVAAVSGRAAVSAVPKKPTFNPDISFGYQHTDNHVKKFGFDPFPKSVPVVAAAKPKPPKLVIPPQHAAVQKPEPTKPQEQPKMGIVLNKRKQQASNLLREQSFVKRNTVQSQQSSLIKSSLANSLVSSQPSGEKDNKDKLFAWDKDDDEMEDEDAFAVKGQFEGSHGQHLLALKGQWGNDSRFKIDSRFQEEVKNQDFNEGDENTTKERNQQLNILNDLLGTQILQDPTSNKKSSGNNKSAGKSVIIKRYDPDAPDDDVHADKYEQEEEKQAEEPSKPKEETSATGTIRASEPATYKTASNLKSLFTSTDDNQESKSDAAPLPFSLLATFGQANNSIGTSSQLIQENSKGAYASGTRKFWDSNPFKYDSSDEDEDEVKTPEGPKQTVLKISPTDAFFFTKKDKRFEGLKAYFIDTTNDERIDFDEKRRELRSIVKAKARNAKRKDEKRTLAIKRSIRKKKKYQKSVIKKTSSNSVKLGG